MRVDDAEEVSPFGRVDEDPQGVAADGAGGTTAGEGGAEVTAAAPKLNEGDPPPKLNGEAAAGLGVDGGPAPKTGTAGEGFGEEKMLGTDAKGLGVVEDEGAPKEKGVEEEGAAAPVVGEDTAPNEKPPPKAGLADGVDGVD